MTMWILQVISFCWAPVSSSTKWRGLISGSYETPRSNGGESGTRSRLLLSSPDASRNLIGPFLRGTGGARRAGETRKALEVTRTRTHPRTHVRGRPGSGSRPDSPRIRARGSRTQRVGLRWRRRRLLWEPERCAC